MFKFQIVKPLTAGEALLKAWEEIKAKYSVKAVGLAEDESHPEHSGAALSVIAQDNDHHRRRRGLMVYPSVEFCTFGDRQWILGLGCKGGSYPGYIYSNDLLAVQAYSEDWERFNAPEEVLRSDVISLARQLGDRNDWFHSSLLTTTKDGMAIFRHQMEQLSDENTISPFVVEKKEVRAVFLGGAEELIGFAYTFSRDFPHFLAEEIAKALGQ
jgi:hypothetical protein